MVEIDEVLEEVKAFHKSESKILDLLQKIDNERLYLELSYATLFKYAVGYLKLSEAQAWAFMTVARKSKEIPELKQPINGQVQKEQAITGQKVVVINLIICKHFARLITHGGIFGRPTAKRYSASAKCL